MSIDYLSGLNEPQRNAVLHTDGPLMIIAGAGSGKTRVLTYRTAYLIEQGIDPFAILLLTFTNKAAGEMRQRIEHVIGKQAKNIWMGTFHSIFAKILRFEGERLGYT
ncbi:MAG: helicase, partial [Bacteroidota bacterium]